MAFRISRINEQGHRLDSVLIAAKQAVISSKPDADFQAPLPESSQITIINEDSSFKISVRGSFTINGKTLNNLTTHQDTSCEFSCGEHRFYVTVTHDGQVAKRSKGYLTMLAAALVWVLLATQVSVPLFIPYFITSHESKGRNALLETCASELDLLRRSLSKSKKELKDDSQLQRDMLKALSSEVEQIIWTFRNGSDFMNQQELQALDLHIQEYTRVSEALIEGAGAQLSPLKADSIMKSILSQK